MLNALQGQSFACLIHTRSIGRGQRWIWQSSICISILNHIGISIGFRRRRFNFRRFTPFRRSWSNPLTILIPITMTISISITIALTTAAHNHVRLRATFFAPVLPQDGIELVQEWVLGQEIGVTFRWVCYKEGPFKKMVNPGIILLTLFP